MDELERLTRDFDPDPARGLAATMRRVRRRRLVRRAGSTVLSLSLFGAALGLAWSQFQPTTVEPVAGPTSSPTGAPAGVEVASGTIEGEDWALLAYERQNALCWELEFLTPTDVDFCHVGLDRPHRSGILGSPNQWFSYGDSESPPMSVFWGATDSSTQRIIVEPEVGGSGEVVLAGPFPELETSLKIFIAFAPPLTDVWMTAVDADGHTLWRDQLERLPYIEVTKEGAGSGVVRGYQSEQLLLCRPHCAEDPPTPRLECGTDCLYPFSPPSALVLRAEPIPGSVFEGWTGKCAGESPRCVLTARSDVQVTAIFARVG